MSSIEQSRSKVTSDEDLLANFGYNQQLQRTLGRFSQFALAFSIISLTTGIFTNYAFGLNAFGPAMVWLWPVAVGGQLLFGLVLAEMASRMPIAGYSYQWGGRLVGPRFGWFVAWNLILTLGFISGAECLLLLSPIIATVLGLNTGNLNLMILISVIVMLAAGFICIWGVKLTARINNGSVPAEILGTVVLGLIVLGAFTFRSHPVHGWGFLFHHGNIHGEGWWYGAALALLMGVFTVGGFEGGADLSEETVGVQRAVARGIIWAVVISAVLGLITIICFTLGIPNERATAASSTPIAYIVTYWFGSTFTRIILVTVVYAVFALMVVQLAMVGRLIFSLSRDGMFPGSKVFSRINKKTDTPIAALALTTIFYIAVIIYAAKHPSAYGTLVGGGVIYYNLAYLALLGAYAWKRKSIPKSPAWDLGRWAKPLIVFSFLWLGMLLTMFYLAAPFRPGAKWTFVFEGIGLVLIFTWITYVVKKRGAGASLAKGRVDATLSGSAEDATS